MQTQLRLPDELAEAVKQRALTERRSMNSMLCLFLEEAVYGFREATGTIRAQDLSAVRSGVQDDTGNEGRGRGAGLGTVQRPQHDTPTDRGAVGGSIRPDTGAKEKRWLGTVHAKGCKCPACQ